MRSQIWYFFTYKNFISVFANKIVYLFVMGVYTSYTIYLNKVKAMLNECIDEWKVMEFVCQTLFFLGNLVWCHPGGSGKTHPGTQSGAGGCESLLQPHVHMWDAPEITTHPLTCTTHLTQYYLMGSTLDGMQNGQSCKTCIDAFAFVSASMMEATNHEVELGGAEPEIIELLVEFVYTAR